VSPEFQCSSCLELKPLDEMHFLPWWNPVGAFFMAFRCPACFGKSLQQTTDRIEVWDDDAEKQFGSFLDNWEILSHFPELQKSSSLETAKAVLQLVQDTDGKAFAPLVSRVENRGQSGQESIEGGAVSIGPMSDALRMALDQAKEELQQEGIDPAKLTYRAMVKISQRIEAGEKGLHDPNNTGDKLALVLARME
jgi:hypothetical protein